MEQEYIFRASIVVVRKGHETTGETPASSREKAKQPAKPDFAAKPRKRAAANAGSAASISPAERHHLIEVAAYYVAAGHGFTAGASDADWLAAERQIDDMIAAGRFTT